MDLNINPSVYVSEKSNYQVMIDLAAVEKSVIDVCLEVGAFIDLEGNRFDRSRIEQKQGFCLTNRILSGGHG